MLWNRFSIHNIGAQIEHAKGALLDAANSRENRDGILKGCRNPSRVGLMMINPSRYCAKQNANNGRKHKKHAIMEALHNTARKMCIMYCQNTVRIAGREEPVKKSQQLRILLYNETNCR